MVSTERSRIFGLDLMRASAAMVVVYYHATDLLEVHWPRGAYAPLIDGVDLFFVLSGYLIGGILVRMTQESAVPLWRRLVDFWQRRWLRTLPNYYLFLLINIALLFYGLAPGLLNVNVLAYFVFLQNFIIPLDLFFWESWSLAVEEWFYLLFPLLLVLVVWWRAPKWGFLVATLAMILMSVLLRYPAVEHVDSPFMLNLLIRKIVVLRFDTIGYGVLMAWLVFHFPLVFAKWRVPLFCMGLSVFAAATWFRAEDDFMYWGTTFFVVSGLGLAMVLPFMAGWQYEGAGALIVDFLSRISYALYLVHMPLRALYLDLMPGKSMEATLALYVGYWALSILLAAVVYRYWERPFIAMRDGISRRILQERVP